MCFGVFCLNSADIGLDGTALAIVSTRSDVQDVDGNVSPGRSHRLPCCQNYPRHLMLCCPLVASRTEYMATRTYNVPFAEVAEHIDVVDKRQ